MKKAGSDIPAAELDVLGSLWRLKKGTARDVMEHLRERGRPLAYTTVLTLLGRLEARGCVQSKKDTPAHVYRPSISRRKVAADRLGDLVELLGEGRAAPLILQLFEGHQLTAEDVRQLRGILDKLEAEGRVEEEA